MQELRKTESHFIDSTILKILSVTTKISESGIAIATPD